MEEIRIVIRCSHCGNKIEKVFYDKEAAKRFIENNDFMVETGCDTTSSRRIQNE